MYRKSGNSRSERRERQRGKGRTRHQLMGRKEVEARLARMEDGQPVAAAMAGVPKAKRKAVKSKARR